MKHKKGSVRDVVLISVLVFSMAILAFVLYYMSNTVVNQMLDIPQINDSSKTRESLTSFQTTTDRFDYIVFALFIGLALSLIITGWIVGGHPIFMFIYFIVVIISVIISAILANTWEMVSQASVFGLTVLKFPLTNLILNNFPLYIAVIGIIGLVVMFAKPFLIPNEI